MLREKLNAQCILAMTATATRKTLNAIMSALDIPSVNLVQTVPLRNNLQLAVSSSGNNKYKFPLILCATVDAAICVIKNSWFIMLSEQDERVDYIDKVISIL